MPAQWPSDVPYAPVGDSLRIKPYQDPYATEMESGRTRLRPSSTLAVARLQFSLLMTSAELSSLSTWAKLSLSYGTRSFEMLVWKDGAFVQKTCRFMSPHEVRATVDGLHTVEISIQVDDY